MRYNDKTPEWGLIDRFLAEGYRNSQTSMGNKLMGNKLFKFLFAQGCYSDHTLNSLEIVQEALMVANEIANEP